MKQLIFFSAILISSTIFAQKNLPAAKIQVSGGYSRTGSGDLPGFIYGTEYSKYFKQKLSWAAGFSGFIYDGEDNILFPNYTDRRSNGELRYTTAGVQLTGHLGFSLTRTKFHEFQFRLGALVKYQSASLDGYGITFPIATNYHEPVVTFYNWNPQRTIAAGGSAQIIYHYIIQNKISIGVLAGAQTDTEGDLITQLSLMIGRRF